MDFFKLCTLDKREFQVALNKFTSSRDLDKPNPLNNKEINQFKRFLGFDFDSLKRVWSSILFPLPVEILLFTILVLVPMLFFIFNFFIAKDSVPVNVFFSESWGWLVPGVLYILLNFLEFSSLNSPLCIIIKNNRLSKDSYYAS